MFSDARSQSIIDLAELCLAAEQKKLPPNLQLKILRYYYESIALLVSKIDKDTKTQIIVIKNPNAIAPFYDFTCICNRMSLMVK